MLAQQEPHRNRCTSDQQLSVMNTHCTNTTATKCNYFQIKYL